eukprot:6632611-Prymnesium_polylepis.1
MTAMGKVLLHMVEAHANDSCACAKMPPLEVGIAMTGYAGSASLMTDNAVPATRLDPMQSCLRSGAERRHDEHSK